MEVKELQMLSDKELLDVFGTCLLCPGICNNECPVYRQAYLRSGAPSNLGRVAIRIMRSNELGLLKTINLCVECGSCVEYCPVSNPLPSALQVLKRKYSGQEIVVVEGERLSYGDTLIGIASSVRPSSSFLQLLETKRIGIMFFDVYEARIMRIKHGAEHEYSSSEGIESIYCEDQRICYEKPHLLEFLVENNIMPRKKTPAYTLLAPCGKLARRLYELVVNIFGEPAATIDACIISDLLVLGYEKYVERLVEKIKDESKGIFLLALDSFTAKSLARTIEAPVYTVSSYPGW